MKIKEVEKYNNINELFDGISKYFKEKSEKNYIPVLFNEGNLHEEDTGFDFYAKLILLPKGIEVKETWMLNNLVKTMPRLNQEIFGYNLITFRNIKQNKLYDLNPIMYGDDQVIEEDQNNSEYMELSFDDYRSDRKWPLLKYKKNNSNVLLLCNLVLEELIDFDEKDDNDFVLYMEFEYRSNRDIKLQPCEKQHKNGYISVKNINRKRSGLSEIKSWIQGTINIDLKNSLINKEEKEETFDILTFSLDSGLRGLNTSNYNDDLDAGLVVFDNKGLSILKDNYYLYGMTLVSRKENEEGVLLDPLKDVFVFWEGEFNKLPYDIKKQLAQYNVKEQRENIISNAMFSWQLEGNWNYLDETTPFIRLGEKVKEEYLDVAKDMNFSFYYPQSNDNLKQYLINIKKLYGISPIEFDSSIEDIQILTNIYLNNNKELSHDKLYELAEKYSYGILEKLKE